MADRGGAERVLDQRESDILANIQQAILNGSRCFETDDVDGSGILIELRQSLRNLQILHINPENARQIEEAIVSLIDQIEMKMQTRPRPDPFIAQRISTPGRSGRPSVIIPEGQLRMLYKLNYTVPKMAKHFGCSAKLIYKKLYGLGLKQRDRYTSVDDEELDEKVEVLQQKYPNSGSVMMHGFLQTDSINIQRQRLRESISRVNPVSVAQRRTKTTKRRKYLVPMVNSLWHMDGHMKLIRWGIATHGCIDGYSRLITFLEADNNNKASTVLHLLIKACKKYGVPSRIRSDRGGENIMVALFINLINGEGRHSHIAGRSIHNQRIERLWKDVFIQVVEKYYNLFTAMEDRGILDVGNEIHIPVLHTVCLADINKELSQFQEAWNHHRLSTEGNCSPNQLWLDSVLTNINSPSTPITNLYGASLEERFQQKLQEYNIQSLDADEDREVVSVLPNDIRDQMLSVIDDTQTLEQKFMACLQKLTELNML